jgi:uncharacterized pyridoxamine 5'-phosphate oxidase family protein
MKVMRLVIIQEAIMAQFSSGRHVQCLKLYVRFILILALLLILNITLLGCIKNETAGQENILKTEDMNIFVKILTEHPNGVLANRNGKMIRTQIISFQFVEGNKVFFGTGSEKPLYQQLLKFPYVSYCTYPEDFEPVLSLNGKVVFTDDNELKERAFNGDGYAGEFLRNHYRTSDNPNLKIFYIDIEEIETYGEDGPKTYKVK